MEYLQTNQRDGGGDGKKQLQKKAKIIMEE